MLAKRNQMKLKRILSTLLAVVMLLGLLPMGALAGTTEDTNQIEMTGGKTAYYAWDGSGFAEEPTGAPVTGNNPTNGAPEVTTSKTISAVKGADGTVVENQFDITLNVETTQRIEETISSPDAAVVLVIDESNSMNESAGSGINRKVAARIAADAFLMTYAGYTKTGTDSKGKPIYGKYEDPGAARWVAVAMYSDEYFLSSKPAATVSLQWVDVHTAAGLASARTMIGTIGSTTYTGTGGTNTDAGLREAESLWSKSVTVGGQSQAISDVGNKFTILLTDGEPNATTGGNNNIVDYPTPYTPNDKYTSYSYGRWPYYRAAQRAAQIRASGSQFFSICFNSTDKAYNWLCEFSDQCEKPDRADQLNATFERYIEYIKMSIDAWKITDPVAAELNAVGIDLEGHNLQSAKIETVEGAQTVKWDLRTDLAHAKFLLDGKEVSYDKYKENPDKAYTIQYSLTYRVTLNNTDARFKPDTFYKAGRGGTVLDYYLNKDGKYIDDDGKEITSGDALLHLGFKSPAVRGFAGTLSFTKTGKLGEDDQPMALAGAKFALIESGKGYSYENGILSSEGWASAVATSGKDGNVAFVGIPSGLDYKLVELEAPAGYLTSEYETPVSVSFGEVKVGTEGENTPWSEETYTNTVDPKNADYTVTKTWLPSVPTGASATVNFYQVTGYDNDKPVYDDSKPVGETVTLNGNETPMWTATVSLPTVDQYMDTITYVAVESNATGGYAAKNTVVLANAEKVFPFVNVRTGETDPITVNKVWAAPEDARTEVTVGLFRTTSSSSAKAAPELVDSTTLNSTDSWSHEFGAQDRYDENGNAYTYSVKEKDGDNWVSTGTITLDGNTFNVSVNGYTITNAIQQENTVAVSGTKTWVDGDNSGSIRPETLEITLLADGAEVTIPENSADNTVGGDDAGYSFTGLPKYALPAKESDSDLAKAVIDVLGADALDGHEIVYSVIDSADGYTTTGGEKDKDDNYNLTNTREDIHDPIGTDLTVTKVWVDNSAYELRPNVTLEVCRTSNGNPDTVFNNAKDYTHTFTQVSETDPATGEATGEYPDEQQYTFEGTKGTLSKYDAAGYPYTYYAVEQGKDDHNTIAGKDGAVYDVTEDGLTVTNTIKGGSGSTSISVQKIWVIPDGMEKPEVTITLTGDDSETNVHSITLDGEVDENGETTAWTASFTALPKYKDGNGGLIRYTVSEETVDSFLPVEAISNVTSGSVTITNTLDVDDERFTVDVSGTKSWDYAGSAETITTATIRLQSDIGEAGVFADVSGKTFDVTDTDRDYFFTGLQQYVLENGKVREIQYRVTDDVPGYTPVGGTKTVTENGTAYDLTNKFNQTYTSIAGIKTWHDDNSERPTSIWVGLFRDGALYGDPVEVTPDEYGVWSYTFGVDGNGAPTLPVKKTVGSDYSYAIRELDGTGDTTGIENSGSITYGSFTYDVTYDGYDIVNTRAGDDDYGRTRTFTASKIWQGPAAGAVSLELLQNGDTVATLELTADDAEANNASVWQGTFKVDDSSEFPVFDGNGKYYDYDVIETGAVGNAITLDGRAYTVEIENSGNHYTVTNTVNQVDDVNVAVEKIWDFTDNVGAAQPPASIEVQLYADGVVYGGPIDLGTPWTHTFENLPRYNLSHAEINYTVAEVGERNGTVQYGDDHYDVTYAENADHVRTITNTYTATDLYTYRVQRVYTHYQDGVLDNTVSIGGTAERGVKDQLISADTLDTEAYKTADGKSAYGLTGSSAPVTLSEPGVEYVITLNYELRETTPMSGYRVDRVYNHYQDGVQDGSVTVTGTVQSAPTGTTIPAQDTDALKNQDGYGAYSYAGGNGALTLEREGETYVLTLTYELHDVTPPIPGEYSYRVDRVYTHYQDGVQDGSVTVAGGKTTGAEQDVILIGETDIDGFKAADGRDGYTFVSGSPTILTETPENPEGFETIGVRLEESGTTYVITLNYELRETTPEPPPTPTDPEVKTFSLTLHYYDKDSGRELTTIPFTMQGNEGTAWDVSEKAERQFYGYIFDSWEGYGDGLTGIFEDHDVTIDVYYVRDAEIPDEEIPDEPVPLGPQPNTPDDGEIDIDDGQVPLNPGPGGDDVTIEDGEVPLGNLPQTGFTAAPVNPAVTLGMLALSLSMAAAGLAITYTRKVKEEEE